MKQNSTEYRKPIKFPGYVFFPEKNDHRKFDLLIKFLSTSEPSISNVYHFALSIRNKYVAVLLSYDEVLKQIKKWNEETEETKREGFSNGVQGILLAIKYEIYLNSIYSLCENLSLLVTNFYHKKGLSNKFDKQKEQFSNDKKSLDEAYSKILEKTDWYEEVHSIRSEATHFLTGLIFISDSNEAYYSSKKTYNTRKGAPKEINIESIETQVKNIQKDLELFLNEYSKHFIENKFNKNIPVGELCVRTDEGRTGFRSITLDDYLNKRSRKCAALDFNCPHKEKCSFDLIQ